MLFIQITQDSFVFLKLKPDLEGTQRLVTGTLPASRFSILPVAVQRVPDGGEMGPDLMGAPCDKVDFHE